MKAIAATVLLISSAFAAPVEDVAPAQPLEPVYFQRITIRGFWRDQIKRLTTKWLPHCITQMEKDGRGQELFNLVHTAKVLSGEPTGAYTGTPWSDAYVYNTIESICLALAMDPAGDQEVADAQDFLRKKLEEWIPIVLAAQMKDGYIHSFHTVNKRPRYTRNGDHEFYVQGYFLEAGVAHYRITGGKDRRLYAAARRCADHGSQSRSVVLKPDDPLTADWKEGLLGGIVAITRPGKGVLAVPNYVRQNRGGWSQVWIPEKPELAEPFVEPTIASQSTVTTSYRTSEGRFSLHAIHDLRTPKQSHERGTPLFHWWPHRGTREWVQYEFKQPHKVSAVEVYWYDDRGWGGCRIPASWQVLYRAKEGSWKPVSGASAYGVERNRFNRVTFEPVTTGAIRLDVQLQNDQAAGVLEWRVE